MYSLCVEYPPNHLLSENSKRDVFLWETAREIANQGYSLFDQRKYAESITYFDRAIALFPDDFMPWWYRGKALCESGCYQEAIRDFTKLINLDDTEITIDLPNFDYNAHPDAWSQSCVNSLDIDVFFARAMAYYLLGDELACLEDLKRSALEGNKEAKAALWAKGIRWN